MMEGSRPARKVRLALAAGTCLTALLSAGAPAEADFPQDPPNDPEYPPAEECVLGSADEGQHYLYSFMPRCAYAGRDPENAAGMSVDRAWREYTTGDDKVVIAYIEGGVNWQADPEELVEKTYINPGELPRPTTKRTDGVFNVRDFADTKDRNGNGLVDPEDLIVRFSDRRDDDGNGYVDDISGWDFYNDQNDPATLDTAYRHPNGQMRQAAAHTDNGVGEAGICPDCLVLPIKGGAEALDRTDDLAESWMYAADIGADVLISTTADLGYSSFMRDAVEYVWRKGTVMVEASNDFNSTDHQGGMFHPHVLPGNGVVANIRAAPTTIPGAVANPLLRTYRQRSSYTSWGAHNVFSVATHGGTTSEATPTVGGVVALTLAYGLEAARRKMIDTPVTGAEAIQVLRATASDIADPTLSWPGKPGFDLQYGYGRPNLVRAMAAIRRGDIPPVGWINSPDWYSLYDPTERTKVPIRGHVEAERAKRYRWIVEYAPGAEPSDSEFRRAGSGRRRGPHEGRLGTLDLSRIPRSFWSREFALSRTKELETNERYTVTLRLRVRDNRGRVGEDRRAIAVHRDPTLVPGFPRRIGPGGEGQPVLADLQGRGELAIVFGDSDGVVHAISPRGRELPGWPVTTDPTRPERAHRGVDPGHEPILAGVAVGDLDHTGRPSVVAASTTGRVYVWDARGRRARGWPRTLATGVRKPRIPRPDRPFTRPPIQGSTAPPVLHDLDGDGRLEVIQAGWDGRLHAWRSVGRSVRGWPVKVRLPEGLDRPPGYVRVDDLKLDVPPAIAELDGDARPEVVVRSQQSDVPGAGLQPAGVSHLAAYNHDGSPVPGFPTSSTSIVIYYGSAQEFITEGVNAPVAGDVDGDGRDEIAAAPGIFSPTTLFDSDGDPQAIYGPVPDATAGLLQGRADAQTLRQVLRGDLPADIPVNFTTSGAFGRIGGGPALGYAEPGSGGASVAGSLLFAGSGIPINSYMRAHDAATGLPLPGYPSRSQGLDFLGAPLIADVTGDGRAEVIEGGDSSALHAYGTGGGQARGFPKFHPGWILFGPATGDLDSDGRTEVVAMTREGYLMAWRTPGRPDGNDEWWNYRHDERNTARYGLDTRPPGIVRGARLEGRRLSLRAPGDDWYAGAVDRYRLRIGREVTTVAARSAPGERETISLSRAARSVGVQAVDDAGNLGRHLRVRRGPPGGR